MEGNQPSLERRPVVNHINLDTQGEAVRMFFLSLPKDPEGVIVEADGRAVARLVPIVTGGIDGSSSEGAWTKEKNGRRCFLIDREIDGTLTSEEARELAVLQRQMLQHLERVAPLPLEATRRLYEELLAKSDTAQNG
jgi:hypothetical protein